MGGISIWQLLIVLLIVLLLFGAKRLRTLGSDLGAAVKGFRSAVKEGEEEAAEKPVAHLERKDAAEAVKTGAADKEKRQA